VGIKGKHEKRRRERWSVLKNETPATFVEEFVEEKFPVGCTPNVLGKFLKKCSKIQNALLNFCLY
jgi:hypothetical protein